MTRPNKSGERTNDKDQLSRGTEEKKGLELYPYRIKKQDKVSW